MNEKCEWKMTESVIHIFYKSSCGGKYSPVHLIGRESLCPGCGKEIEIKDEL
jgi:hypothetical protein